MTIFLTLKPFFIVGWLGALLVLERFYPFVRWHRPRDLPRAGRNLGLAAFNVLLGPALVVGTSLAASNTLAWRPDVPLYLHVVVDILLLDCFIYFWHRANHRVPFLWRFHEVHHLDTQLDATSALRFHFGEVLLSSCARGLFVVLLDIQLVSVLLAEFFLQFAALFHHSRWRLPSRWESVVSKILVTPSIHWVHHHAVQRDTDSNYANFFSWWDRLFGTRSPMQRHPAMRIGVEGETHEPRFMSLVWRPFVHRSVSRTAPSFVSRIRRSVLRLF